MNLFRRRKAPRQARLASGWLQFPKHRRGICPGHPVGEMSQERVFDAQAERAAAHDQMLNAVQLHPRRANEAVLRRNLSGRHG